MKTILLIGALFGATVLAYRNTIPGRFIYDDKAIIVQNQLIRSLKQIPLIFGTSYWGTNIGQPKEAKGGLYRPLTVTTFALNYWTGGLNPRGYHLANLIMHLAVCILLGILGCRLGLSQQASYAAAILFALLPVHTEAVSNVVGRSEILAAFFVLASWIFVTGSPGKIKAGLGAVSFALALLSKENAAAFLPVLLISDYVVSKKSSKGLLQERFLIWVAYAGALLLYLEWKYLVLGSVADVGGMPYFGSQNFLTIGLTMAQFTVRHYLKPLILGTGFCADFTRPVLQDAQGHDLAAWASAFLMLGMIVTSLVSALKYKNRYGFYFALFFLLLFPASNLATRLEVIGAERFLYLPSIGYCLGLALFFEKRTRTFKPWAIIGLAGLCLWYGWATFQRNKAWQTEESFWKTTLRDAPESPRAWNGMGLILMNQRKYDEAVQLFKKAIKINPMLLDAHYNIATCYSLQKDYAQAKREYAYVLNEKPYDSDTLFHMAYIHEQERDFRAAAVEYAMILKVNPLDRAARRNLALLHCRIGDRPVCRDELNAYLRDAPPEEPDEDVRTFIRKLDVK